MKRICFIFSFLLLWLTSMGQLKSPEQFMPHQYGEAFTPHHLLVDYAYHVAENSKYVDIIEYGRTNQKRPLVHLYISSSENLERLDEIQSSNLKRTGLKEGDPDQDNIAICWLSFGVHGNEAGASESSMNTLYELGAANDTLIQKWLKNTLVILDPSVNPDGYSRYTHWVNNVAGKAFNPDPLDREHHEPWPGGRVNHYLFDLNRDWAWQTQVESKHRMVQYNKWMPHIHVDIHEMGYNDSYYFAPAAKPYHNFISNWQSEFQLEIGRNHAKYFDKEGWFYFTREVFDLFYPSYGDTYPMFNGAIGMTYEQGGHARAGREIEMENGNTLKLRDRIDHHTVAALSTVEMTSKHADEILNQFEAYFKKESPSQYKSYVLKSGKYSDRMLDLCMLLDRQLITYETVLEKQDAKGYHYTSHEHSAFLVEPGDLVINTDQAKAVLISVLFDPDAILEDSLTYDLTAWSVPYAYGIDAYAVEKNIKGTTKFSGFDKIHRVANRNAYAYAFSSAALNGSRLLSEICKAGIGARVAHKDFINHGDSFEKGTIVISAYDNSKSDSWRKDLISLAEDQQVQLYVLNSGIADQGPDLGSASFEFIKKPSVLVLGGDETSPYGFGQVWHYFENVIDYPLTIVNKRSLLNANLNEFNTIILPESWLSFREDELNILSSWVSNGGKLIVLGAALSSLSDTDQFNLKRFSNDKAKNALEEETDKRRFESRFHDYEEGLRKRISDRVPGTIVKSNMDNSHPLGFGQEEYYYSLKTGGRRYGLLSNGGNVSYVPKDAKYIGFIGENAKTKLDESLIFGVDRKGQGSVIYMVDNPLFRGFWVNGLLLFSNALFF